MFDKVVKLVGQYPSDFKPTTNVMEVQKYFDAYKFYDGRMLGGSKMDYHTQHPDELIIFNANVLMPGYGKVWYGDLNLTEDYLVLKDIAKSLNTTLYVLWESDGRFGKENKPIDELIKKAVWNTDELKPTKKWYKNKMKEKNKTLRDEMEGKI
jgi:hypothetical protein